MHSSSRGGNGYGHQQQQQQPYSSEAAYTTLGSRYSGSSIGGRDVVSQPGGSPRLGTLGSVPEGDAVGYRGHGQSSVGTHYGGKYSSVYEFSGQQIPQSGAKGSIQPVLPKFTTGDYALSSSRSYGGVGDQLYSDRISDYTSGEKHQFVQHHSAYIGRDMPNEAAVRYAESANSGHTHQTEHYGRLDQALLLRQEQLLKAHSLQSTSADGNARQSDYGAPRSTSLRPTIQDHRQDQDESIYAARIDPEPRTLSYGALCNPSILGAASSRNVDNAAYVQTSLNPGYGVVLPPGRDYGAGKGVYGTSLDQDYHMLVRASQSSIDRELERREKDLQELRERVIDRVRERDREKERERERDRERARERDRLRERERVRGIDQERGKVREREWKKKAKARKRKAVLDSKHEGTPPVPSKERRGASLTKDRRSLLRGSSHGSSHRRPSPVKEKRREYVCKVHSSKLADIERDYLSLDKRYPKLVVSPECAKVVVNWPKENLKLSLYAPVRFEHDFVEDDAAKKIVPISKQPAGEMVETEPKGTVWNSKVILMSGLSQKSLEELSSDRIYGERIPHFCNMLRFAILRKEKSLMAIGGRWDPSDGGDPSVDDDSLVKTILRCAKEIAHLDLTSCKRWNRFLEVHYDRVGKDGLFSHKEVTVIYVPDLSDCLPSLESWHNQWLDHKKVVSERVRLKTLVKQNAEEKNGCTEDVVHTKDKKKDTPSSGNKVKESPIPKETESKQKVETTDDVFVQVDQKEIVQTPGSVKPKKKVIKQKAIKKKDNVVAEAVVASDELPDVGEKTLESDITPQKDGSSSSAQGIKTLKRKKIVKKLVTKAAESNAKQNANEIVADTAAKTTVKKKIVKKVPKKNVVSEDALKCENEDFKDEESTEKIDSKAELESKTSKKQDKLTGKKTNQTSSVSAPDSEKEKVSVQDDHSKPKGKDVLKDEKGRETHGGKADSKGRSDKDLKEKKRSEEPPRHPGFILQTTGSKDSKTWSLSLSLDSLLDYSDEDLQESTFEISLFAESLYEMLQYEMGCRLLTFLEKLNVRFVKKRNERKRQREDAPKKETGEKTSPAKRVKIEEGNDVKSEKTGGLEKNHSDGVKGIVKEEKTEENVQTEDDKMHGTEEESDPEENPEEEDPEEEEGPQDDMEDNPEEGQQDDDPEVKKEDEEMIDAAGSKAAQHMSEKEKVEESDKKVESESKNEDVKKDNNNINVKDKQQEGSPVVTEAKNKGDVGDEEGKVSKKQENKEKKKNVNKELLQAFRFFDRNRVGYVRVEDMKLIIHKLGKFLSHRAVKDMVLSALLESNKGRDDRILYHNLVTISHI